MRIFIFLILFCLEKNQKNQNPHQDNFFMFRIFFKNYTKWDFHFFVIFFHFKKNRFLMQKTKIPKNIFPEKLLPQ